jgi:hypothetical protein
MEDPAGVGLGSELLKDLMSSASPGKKIAVVAVFLCSCATPRPDGADRGAGHFVVVVDGKGAFDGPAAFTVRDADVVERVVSVPGVGEVIVKGDGCRFVRADRGLAALQILERQGACAEERGDRLCFEHVAFGGPGSVVVDGCASRNEIFLDRVGDDGLGHGLGPRTLLERCVPVPGDDPSYVRVDRVVVDGVPQYGVLGVLQGKVASVGDGTPRLLRFRWNGEGFDVCFLSQKKGGYRVELTVDDAPVVVEGDVGDL